MFKLAIYLQSIALILVSAESFTSDEIGDIICQNSNNGSYFMDPNNCTGYYICVNHSGYHEFCSEGLYWNQAIQSCDLRETVNCTTICDGQTDNDHLSDPNNCAGFYECLNNTGIHHFCPADLYWNQAIRSCDFPENVNCTADMTTTTPSPNTTKAPSNDVCEGQANGTHLADPKSCSGYYICSNNKGIHETCPDSLYWNQAIRSCDFRENVNCTDITTTTPSVTTSNPNRDICDGISDGTYVADPKSCSGYYACSNNKGSHLTCPGDLYWNQPIQSCDLRENVNCTDITTSPSPATTRIPSGDICDGQANDTYLADPNSCSGYYRCINNVGVHDTCPDGLYWHQAIKSCDFQEHVNCTDGITTTTTSPSPATTTSPNEDICHGKADGTYLEDPKNCAGYYHCSNNQGIHEYCLDGLYWNQIILSCDFPSHVNCSTGYCFIAFLTLSKSIVGTAAIDAECAGYPSGEITYFPDPYDCQKYYECYEGTLYVMACPNDLYWNQNAQVCDYKDNVDCSRGNQTTSIPKTTPKVTTPAGNDSTPDVLCQGYPVDEITYLPYPYDCQKYYECYGGKLYIMTCGDLYWNQKDEVCDYKENVDCTPSNSTTSAPPKTTTAKGTTKPNNDSTPDVQCQGYPTDQITYLPDPYDCQKYYECYGGELYVMSCGDLYWNQKAQVCDYKDNVDCTPSNSTTPTPKTTTTKGTTKPNNDSTPDVMCQGYPVDEITYLPYPDDCQKYYECYAGKLYVMSCGDLYWNQDAHVCDYKDNVNCTTDNVCNGYPTDQVTYLQYPYDCKKYYECTKGQAYIMTCPGELYWNQNITSCDKKDNVVCRSVTTALPTTTPKPTTPSDPATWCKGQADGTYFADPTDCASFYECLSGSAIKQTCPAGDYWNQNILNCDFEANVNCDVK